MTIAAAAFTAETTPSGRMVAWNNDNDMLAAQATPDVLSGRWIIRRVSEAGGVGVITVYNRRNFPAGRNGDDNVRVDLFVPGQDAATHWSPSPEAALAWAAVLLAA